MNNSFAIFLLLILILMIIYVFSHHLLNYYVLVEREDAVGKDFLPTVVNVNENDTISSSLNREPKHSTNFYYKPKYSSSNAEVPGQSSGDINLDKSLQVSNWSPNNDSVGQWSSVYQDKPGNDTNLQPSSKSGLNYRITARPSSNHRLPIERKAEA